MLRMDFIINLIRVTTFLHFDSLSNYKHSQQALSMHIFLCVCVICSMMSDLDSESLLGKSELMLTHNLLPAALRGLSPAE